jgi:hypothetical protein
MVFFKSMKKRYSELKIVIKYILHISLTGK